MELDNLQKQFPDVPAEALREIYQAGISAERTRAVKWAEFYHSNEQAVIEGFTTGKNPAPEGIREMNIKPVIDLLTTEQIDIALFGSGPLQFSMRFTLLTGISDPKVILKGAEIYANAQRQVMKGANRKKVVDSLLKRWKELT